jgi:uroporphyrinogen III methyltransferase/synthase
VIVGDVVALRQHIAWFERQPLRGRRILVARARPGRSEIAARLRTLGAEVLELPEVAVAPASDESSLSAALARTADFDAVVFGCAAGVDAVFGRTDGIDLPAIAVGRAASAALARWGVKPALDLDGACAEVLRAHAAELRGRRLLLISAEGGRSSLRSELAALDASVEAVGAYRHVSQGLAGRVPPIDLVVLPSSSAARAVLEQGAGDALRGLPMVAMGPRTEAEARRLGAVRVRRAAADTLGSLVSHVTTELSTGDVS